MPEVGINLTMRSNVPEIAKQSSAALREMSDSAGEMNQALQLGDLEKQYRAFADRVDKIHDVIKANREAAKEIGRAHV